jgi:hypothetical protein
MKFHYPALGLLLLSTCTISVAQPCTPQGDQTTYGTNDVWIGYVYDNTNFTGYRGYINQGISGDPSFNQSFGGSNVSYPTNGCAITTETFSVRYKLQKTFTGGNYEFIAGGDDGYRLSIDGGTTWIIDRWFDQGYNTSSSINFLNGTYDLVLEFYENGGGNQVSFQVQPACVATGDPSVYGTGDTWQGYVYDGINFANYRGNVTKGLAGNPNFDENFGGANSMYNTNACAVQTETFSVRYRLQKTFANGTYIFILGGDDGYRFSIDGGSTWVVDRWWDQSYNTTSYTAALSGTHNLVIEYYESGGDNRISFDMTGSLLPVRLLQFTGDLSAGAAELEWKIALGSNPHHFEIERSHNGQNFQTIGKVAVNGNGLTSFRFSDKMALPGNSYYRLKISDLDGNRTYSSIITLRNRVPEEIIIYPTIIRDNRLFISSGKALKEVSVTLFDITGKKISNHYIRSMSSGQTVLVPLLHISGSGTHFVEIKSHNERKTKQVLMIK